MSEYRQTDRAGGSEHEVELNRRRVVWIAFVGAVLVYGVLGLVFAGSTDAAVSARETGSGIPAWLWPVLGAGALVMGIFSPRIAVATGGGEPMTPMSRDIVTWAASEAVAVIGLVSVFLGQPREWLVIYCAASVVLLVLHRPR